MPETIEFFTKGHPEANGRKPQRGEHAYTFTFPLADGKSLKIHGGQEDLNRFREFIGSMLLDDEAEREQ